MLRDEKVLEAIQFICDRLSERTATLFLGAGVNAGIKNNAGEFFPLGAELSRWLCRDLLDSSDLQLSLDEAAEIARHRLGEEEVNRYLYQQFSSFSFGTAHLALVQLPWDVMYTTNYDLLVENAAKAASIEPSGIIQPIFSTKTELTPFSEKHILYYKLHGSIDVANTEEGRLIRHSAYPC
jgi:SIR2-like domain